MTAKKSPSDSYYRQRILTMQIPGRQAVIYSLSLLTCISLQYTVPSFLISSYSSILFFSIHHMYLLHRYAHKLPEQYGWVLCCSCDQSRMQFVQALNEQIETDLDKGIIVNFEITMLKSCTTKKSTTIPSLISFY